MPHNQSLQRTLLRNAAELNTLAANKGGVLKRSIIISLSLFCALPRPMLLAETVPSIIDTKQWSVVKVLPIDFGDEFKGCRAYLLKSIVPTNKEEPNSLKVGFLVVRGENELFAYDASREKSLGTSNLKFEYFVDEFLEARDLTSDGIPEVMFHSGYHHATGTSKHLHIVSVMSTLLPSKSGPMDRPPRKFVDLTSNDFFDPLKLLTVENKPYLATARNIYEKNDFEGQFFVHAPRYVQYLVYAWDPECRNFIVSHVARSKKTHSNWDDMFEGELGHIEDEIKAGR